MTNQWAGVSVHIKTEINLITAIRLRQSFCCSRLADRMQTKGAMSNNQKIKSNFGLIAVVAVSAVVGSFASSFVVKSLFQTQTANASIDEVLAATADEINRRLPMMVDQNTRLDSTVALPKSKLMYRFTILNIDPLPDGDVLVETLRPTTLNNYKTSQDMADLRKMNVTLVYSYADDKGNELARFQVSPQDFE